ncbi:hypothetical protein GCM10020001_089560 [Nonomuraea salmonea]
MDEEALAPDLVGQPGEGLGVAVVACDEPQVAGQPVERGVVRPTARLAGVLAQPVEVEVGPGDADDRQVEPAVGGQAVEGRQQHLAGEVAGDAEQHQRPRRTGLLA